MIAHKRYFEFHAQHCANGCPDSDDNVLKILLYNKDSNLRCHTAKHYLDVKKEKAFKRSERFSEVMTQLKEIGCPKALGTTHEVPPCCAKNDCGMFNTCSKIISAMEDEYIHHIKQFIEEGLALPRYACHFKAKDGYNYLTVIPNRKVFITAYKVNNYYNLATCYSVDSNKSHRQLYEEKLKRIREQAGGWPVILCNEINWGADKASKKQRKLEKRGRTKRMKGGGKNFRHFLDEIDDDIFDE